ncbi:hypothetical protein DM860_012727 [Cuscuta australis]|uniref:Uncharacterized protein n=1 Tax=Cuscuta australis TaxID=267555 RepID=A0A328DUB8_9ASTE|nr:hypothetical protein DM860_012727 [Cuscuta australis]
MEKHPIADLDLTLVLSEAIESEVGQIPLTEFPNLTVMKMWTYLRLAAIDFKVILDPNQGPMVQSRDFIAHSLEDLLNFLPCKIQEDSNAILVPIPLREAIASLEDMVHQKIHEPTMEIVIQNEFEVIGEHLGEEKFLFHIE